MSSPVVTPSTPLVVGVQATLTPPNNVANVAAVVIQNLSGYLLTVMIAGSQYSLPAYTSDLFLTSGTGSQLSLLPTNPDNSPAGLPAYAIAQWFGPGSVPEPASYPSALTPPAYALGVAIAEQLLAGGIPSVLLETVIAQANIAPGIGGTVTYDVHAAASLGIQASAGGSPIDLELLWRPAGTNLLIGEDRLWSSAFRSASAGGAVLFARLAVIAGNLQIINNGPAITGVVITGTNRSPLQRIDARFRSTAGYRAQWAAPILAGVDQDLAPVDAGQQIDGPVSVTFKQTGAATGRFDLVLDTTTPPGRTITLCDTTEMAVNAGGNLYLQKQLILPPAGWSWRFHAQTAQGAGTISVDIVG